MKQLFIFGTHSCKSFLNDIRRKGWVWNISKYVLQYPKKLSEQLPRDISCCDRMNIENVVKSNCSKKKRGPLSSSVYWTFMCTYVRQYIIFLLQKSNLFRNKRNVLTTLKHKSKRNNGRKKLLWSLYLGFVSQNETY